jgi:DMSO/TMAO reductase YedYZ molybdopterin-dependent catalytic subunit
MVELSRVEEEQRMERQGRLPPGQSLTQKFPVLHYGPVPVFNAATWTFKVWGEVEERLEWTWHEIMELPRKKLTLDLHCVTRWSKFNTVWEGVSVADLVEKRIIRPTQRAKFVMQHADHGYTTNLPLDIILSSRFLLATHYNDQPVPREHGYPVRGVIGQIPGEYDPQVPYLWKGAKWLRGLEFMDRDRKGFWEKAGYHNRGGVWEEERLA